MPNNFRRTAVLKKISIVNSSYKLKQRIVGKNFGGAPVLKFKFSIYLFVIFPRRSYRQTECIGKLKRGSRSSSACNALKFFQ